MRSRPRWTMPARRAFAPAALSWQIPCFPMSFAEGVRGVICIHHDQANFARKLHGFQRQREPFFGPPVRCATNAHGTAFDLVGNEAAGPTSFMAVLRFVVRQWAVQ